MRKRIISALLCLVLLVGMLPTSAFAIWGVDGYYECIFCGAIYYGDDVDDSIYEEDNYCCGIDGNDDCWLELHCYECGEYVDKSRGNDCCHWCDDCIEDNGTHCSECDECYLSDEDQLCGECHRCDTCAGGICEDCGLCDDCAEDGDNTHCLICGACASSADWHDDTHHCQDCCIWCEQCGDPETCTADDSSVEYCDECGLCMTCCMENRDAYGCDEYCVESSEFEYHFCEDCGECFCDKVLCEYCGLCEDCCEANSECTDTTDPMCVEDSDYEDHFCPECGECTHAKGDLCDTCGLCETCCEEALNSAKQTGCDRCNDYDCVEDDEFITHMQTHDPNYQPPGHTCRYEKSWSMDENYHWKACVNKSCKEPYTNAAHSYHAHDYGSDNICKDCGYMRNAMVYFTTQPKTVYVKVSDRADVGDDGLKGPTFPWNYRTTFRVKAFGKNLSYQWYQVHNGGTPKKLEDNNTYSVFTPYYVNGATTPTLTISVRSDSCSADICYYCVVTDPEGNTATSKSAYIKGSHRYNLAVQYPDPNDDSEDAPSSEVSFWISKESVGLGVGWYSVGVNSGGEGHRWYCCGDGCTATRSKVSEPHDFQPTGSTVRGTYSYKNAVAGNYLEFDLNQCTICGAKKYIEKHEHEYRLANTASDLGGRDLRTATTHPTICKTESCGKLSSERHTWVFEEYKWPGQDGDDGIVRRVCNYCGYVDSEDFTWTVKNSSGTTTGTKRWNTSNILVEVVNGSANCALAEPGDTVVLTPKLDGEHKFTGWTANYNYYTSADSSEHNKSITLTGAISKKDDGTWSYTIPSDFFTANDVPGGGILTFHGQRETTTCTHANNTTTGVGAKAAVCIYDGYTGDEICNDCGHVVTPGDVIEGGTEHTGTLTPVKGTAVEGSCTKRGYEGDFKCDACERTVSGARTGYVHKNQTIVNYKAATCFVKGYSGDTVCADCGKSLANGKETPTLDHIWGEGEISNVSRGPFTYLAMVYHCTRAGCTGTKTAPVRRTDTTTSTSGTSDLDFTMTGYELGKTVGDAKNSLTVPSELSGKISINRSSISRGISLKKVTDSSDPTSSFMLLETTRNSSLPLANGVSFQEGKSYYLVINVTLADGVALDSIENVTLNNRQSALYFGNVKIRETIGGTTNVREATIAVFKLAAFPATSHDVTVKYSEAANTGAGTYETGASVTINAGRKAGYVFSGWTGDGISDSYSSVTSFTMPDHDVTLVANWTKDNYVAPSKPAHKVDVKDALNGSASANHNEAREGTIITVTVDPAAGYAVDQLTVTDANGNAVAVTSLGGGKYTFIMPDSDVVVRTTFTDGLSTGFVDVPGSKYFYDAVNWAVASGITSGTDATHFSPYASCTRGQLVTFLWRAAGKPAAKSSENPFSDVKENSAFYKAILWAAENGIVTGYADGTFRPGASVTRQQTAAILYRYAKFAKMDVSVGEDTNILSFNDALSVSEYAVSAFQWAVGEKVITGNAGSLLPHNTCTRAQIVTMLYRLLVK